MKHLYVEQPGTGVSEHINRTRKITQNLQRNLRLYEESSKAAMQADAGSRRATFESDGHNVERPQQTIVHGDTALSEISAGAPRSKDVPVGQRHPASQKNPAPRNPPILQRSPSSVDGPKADSGDLEAMTKRLRRQLQVGQISFTDFQDKLAVATESTPQAK